MAHYKHLIEKERLKIYDLWQAQSSTMQIAKAMRKAVPTISRELIRNELRYFRALLPRQGCDAEQGATIWRGCLLDRNPALQKPVKNHLCSHE